ncbi:MAG TPA: serine hydrolase [Solirubrobacteraceae bacterium]|nr:serine hydrolase [Solirubrobacteraceae bacterium]
MAARRRLRGRITAAALRSARAFARHRRGRVAFCVATGPHHLRGLHLTATYRSASVVKAMLLVADLRLAHRQRRGLTGRERSLLPPMIRVSDNNAALAVYSIVGKGGLFSLGRAAGMRQLAIPALFATQISPADQSRFMRRLPKLIPHGFRGYALHLLSTIVPAQSWGVPRGLRPRGFRVSFKGGWVSGLVNQVALVRYGHERVGVAIFTDHDPSMAYGERTIEGIAARLFRSIRKRLPKRHRPSRSEELQLHPRRPKHRTPGGRRREQQLHSRTSPGA